MRSSSFLAAILTLLTTTSSVAQSIGGIVQCEGRSPAIHNDGTYHFNTQSWRRARANMQYYGRCVQVLPPTTEMLNTWVGVLFENAIARENVPTINGDDFIDIDSIDAVAPLYYGNSDDMINAGFLAHRSETVPRSAPIEPSFVDRIREILIRDGRVEVESFKQLSFLIEPKDGTSLATLIFRFRSVLDSDGLRYTAGYSLEVGNANYSGTDLSISFSQDNLAEALRRRTDFPRLRLVPGTAEVTFSTNQNATVGMMRTNANVVSSGERVITKMPMSFLMGSANR